MQTSHLTSNLKPARRFILLTLLSLLVLLADRATKLWAGQFFTENGATTLHPLLTLTEVYNRGIGFGLFQGSGPLVGWVTILLVGVMVVVAMRMRGNALILVGMALLIGGALGNMIDRITAGQVLDFLATPLWPRVFNVADISVRLGVLVLIAGFVRQEVNER